MLKLMRAIFPDLAREIETAFASHGERSPEEVFDERLDSTIDEVLPGAARFDLGDDPAAHRFDRAFSLATTIASKLGVSLPEPEAFAEAGVDFAKLARLMRADANLDLIAAPYGLGASTWKAVFARLPEGPQLLLAPEVEREFAILDAVPTGATAVANDPLPQSDRRVQWSLRLIPVTWAPTLLGLSYAHGPHVTLPEMLMLQLMRLTSGLRPVDAASFTWLAGPVSDARLAARHVFDESDHAIRINCREVHHQGPHLGARSPVS